MQGNATQGDAMQRGCDATRDAVQCKATQRNALRRTATEWNGMQCHATQRHLASRSRGAARGRCGTRARRARPACRRRRAIVTLQYITLHYDEPDLRVVVVVVVSPSHTTAVARRRYRRPLVPIDRSNERDRDRGAHDARPSCVDVSRDDVEREMTSSVGRGSPQQAHHRDAASSEGEGRPRAPLKRNRRRAARSRSRSMSRDRASPPEPDRAGAVDAGRELDDEAADVGG